MKRRLAWAVVVIALAVDAYALRHLGPTLYDHIRDRRRSK